MFGFISVYVEEVRVIGYHTLLTLLTFNFTRVKAHAGLKIRIFLINNQASPIDKQVQVDCIL
jgi:hypothetical protein